MRIFVSSISRRFEKYRQAARKAITTAGHEPVMFEDFAAKSDSPRSVCLDAVRQSNALILLAGTRYGEPTEAGISPSEEEYWQARFGLKPVLVFVQAISGQEREARLSAFLTRIEEWGSGHFRVLFHSATDLREKIVDSLASDISTAVDRSLGPSSEGLHEWLTALRSVSRAYSEPNSHTMPQLGTLTRPEMAALRQLLDSSTGVLLIGNAGVGKTGLTNLVVRQILDDGAPVLFLRASAFPRSATSISVVTDTLPVSKPLPQIISVIGQVLGAFYIVIDQLDSVGGSAWAQALVAFLSQMATLPNVHILCTSRAYDAENYPEIRGLPFPKFVLDQLSRHQAGIHLSALSISSPTPDLVELARNLLNLSLIADLVTKGAGVSDVHTATALWHQYRQSLATREGPLALARAVELAKQVLAAGQSDFALEIAPDAATQKLLSRNIIVRSVGERYRFFHEEATSYLYAWDASLRRQLLPEAVKGEVAEHSAASVFRWIHRMYHEDMGEMEATFLKRLLDRHNVFSFFTRVSGLDVLKDQADPRQDVADLLAKLLGTEAYAQYFFQDLKNPAWLKPLADRGVFDKFPAPVVKNNKTVTAPPWWPGNYLTNVASSDPKFVVNLARRVKTDNWLVYLNLMDAARRLPGEYAAQLVPWVVNWLNEAQYGEIFLVPKAIEFLLHLAGEGYSQSVATLFEALLQVVKEPIPPAFEGNPYAKPRAMFRHDRYELKTLLSEHLVEKLSEPPDVMLGIIERRLGEALELEGLTSGDVSFIWLPAIERPEPNGTGCLELLAVALRDILEAWIKKEPGEVQPTLKGYLSQRQAIFRRIAINAIRQHPDHYLLIAKEWLETQEALDDVEIHHELWMLLRDIFSLLEQAEQERIVERILQGPKERGTEEDRPERLEARKQRWILRWLWSIREHLHDQARSTLEAIAGRIGEPAEPDFLVTTHAWVGEESPHDRQSVLHMNDEELLAALKDFLPTEGFRQPSKLGLASELKGAVNESPDRFAHLLPQLVDENVDDVYLSHVLWGLQDSWESGGTFTWNPILDFCETWQGKIRSSAEAGEQQREVKKHIADLLQAGMLKDDHAFAPELLDRAREIILTLLEDPDPTPGDELPFLSGGSFGAATAALNCVRGKAMNTLVVYALRRARVESDPQTRGILGVERLEQVVKQALTDKLDKTSDPSVAVHSVFGRFLPQMLWLDQKWVFGHLQKIFPEALDYWEAAWSAYVGFSAGPLEPLFDQLREHYRRAILSVKDHEPVERPSDHLASHVMLLYLRGLEELSQKDSLVELFFSQSPSSVRVHAVWFLWKVLENDKPEATSLLWARFLVLWQHRVNVVLASSDKQRFGAELSAYAWWLKSAPADLPDLFQLIEATVKHLEAGSHEKDVLEYLEQKANAYPRLVAGLLKLMVEGIAESWYLRRDASVKQILRACILSGDTEAKGIARQTVNLFGEKGDYTYRDLLDL